MKLKAYLLCFVALLVWCSCGRTSALAQGRPRTTTPANNATPAPTPTTSETSTAAATARAGVETADIAITATVQARELRFDQVPNPNVVFSGHPQSETVWEADRQNLPRPVQPGVTYRNIGVLLTITSVFPDIDRIVAEALGETPVSEQSTPAAERPSLSQTQEQASQPTSQVNTLPVPPSASPSTATTLPAALPSASTPERRRP